MSLTPKSRCLKHSARILPTREDTFDDLSCTCIPAEPVSEIYHCPQCHKNIWKSDGPLFLGVDPKSLCECKPQPIVTEKDLKRVTVRHMTGAEYMVEEAERAKRDKSLCEYCGKPLSAEPVSPLPAQEEEKLKRGAKLFVDQYGGTMKKPAEDDAQEEGANYAGAGYEEYLMWQKRIADAVKLAREEAIKLLKTKWYHAGRWHDAECNYILHDQGVCNCKPFNPNKALTPDT